MIYRGADVQLTSDKLLIAVILASFLGALHLVPSYAQGNGITGQRSKIANIIEQVAIQVTGKISQSQSMTTSSEETLSTTPEDLSSLSNEIVHVNANGEIELLLHSATEIGAKQEAEIAALGARVVVRIALPNLAGSVGAWMIQAWIPADKIDEAAALPWVVAVTPPDYGEVDPHPVNPINSEGVGLHNADLAQTQGINGAGVTVGAISDGVSNLAAAQALNELPAVNVLATGSGDEGTAMLEIIHDMAPGAALMFSGTGGGVANHVNAQNNLAAAGANIIAEDIAFDAEPAFQQGIAASNGDALAAAGVAMHSSAGNRGANHAARVTAVGTGGGPDGNGGPFTGCAVNPLNVIPIAPGGDTTFDVVLGNQGTRFTLQWSEPRAVFPTAGQGGFTNLDLFVMDQTGTVCLGQSVGVQGNGIGDTIEQVALPGTMVGTAVKVVVNVTGVTSAAAVPVVDLRWRGTQSQTDNPTRASSLNPDSNYTGLAASAAAVNGINGLIEGFSSGGPVQLGLTTVWAGSGVVGNPGPGVTNTPAPAWAAADGVAVSGVGGFGNGTCPAVNPGDCRFFGTSASAPHAAGCDALIRQLLGAGAPVAQVNARLTSTATDIGAIGPDNVSGAGILNCFAALGPPEAVCQNVSVPTDPGVCVAGSASVDNGSSDPFGQAISLSQAPTAPYALGNTAVTLTVTDTDNLFDTCSATVTVLDQEDPNITAPSDRNAECSSHTGTPVAIGTATASDNCDVSPDINNDAPALFTLGMTTVTWTATDDSGNTDTDTQKVTVVDTTPPDLTLSVLPTTLWPPNHKLVTIVPTAVASDICDPDPVVTLVSITSNEPANGLGDGNTDSDIVIIDDFNFKLHAERSGKGVGREYTITYQAEDSSGNTTTAQAVVSVAHNQ